MNYAASQYGRSSGSYLNNREIELLAINFVNKKLREATSSQARRDALAINIKLWSVFLNGVQDQNSPLPPVLKQDLISVGTWAMRYSNAALNRALSFEPLVEINQDMADGLASVPAGFGDDISHHAMNRSESGSTSLALLG